MTETMTFNGNVISDHFLVADVQRPPVGRDNVMTEVSGMDGSLITGSTMPQATITVLIVISDAGVTERREAIRTLMGMVHTTEPARLEFASDNGRYYMAMLDGDVPFTEHVRSGLVELNFVTEKPLLYGNDVVSVTIPSGGSETFTVGGTYRTRPIIAASSATASGGLWGLRLDDGDTMRVSVSGTKPVRIDCEERTVFVNDTLVPLNMAYDWFELEPGQHKIQNDVGTGACTVTWREMWI